jgi:hypothetical protein
MPRLLRCGRRPFSVSAVSVVCAEREGFEPLVGGNPPKRFSSLPHGPQVAVVLGVRLACALLVWEMG